MAAIILLPIVLCLIKISTNTSPMIKEAIPITTIPVPILASEKDCFCATKAPDKATKPLATAKPMIFILSTLIEEERTISSLSPVARIDKPNFV